MHAVPLNYAAGALVSNCSPHLILILTITFNKEPTSSPTLMNMIVYCSSPEEDRPVTVAPHLPRQQRHNHQQHTKRPQPPPLRRRSSLKLPRGIEWLRRKSSTARCRMVKTKFKVYVF
nr:hypothetical protein Iba_scaffold17576CG0010 [Ipomoea batatas]